MKAVNNGSGSNRRYIVYACTYIVYCFLTFTLCVFFLNGYIEKNSVNQMKETIGLIAEKVNVSFEMMSEYVEQEAEVLAVQNDLDFESEYYMLLNLIDDMDYSSVGMLGRDGGLYCNEGEKIDLVKYGYYKEALGIDKLYITEPYLSCVSGSNVITMFYPIIHNGVNEGSLFVTYPLECVQNLAKSSVLKHEVESYLMNGMSGNYITCSNSANHAAGIWGNLSLIKNDMICADGYDYNSWVDNMAVNAPDSVLCYKMDGVEYTQAYVRINSMENWYVVVRIPNTELTNTLHQYFVCIMTGAGALIAGTMILAFLLYFNEYRQKKKIEAMSGFDPLTNLLNRRAFDKKLNKLFEDPGEIRNSIYIFVDIDYFKEINDNYGHAAGDEILQKVSASMKGIFSAHGLVARIGGDEFNIFMTNAQSSDMVEELIRRFESEILDISLSDGTKLPVKCSIGMAKFSDDERGNLTSLTVHADEALYYIKRNGKNGFCWYSDIKEKAQEK